jgi:hypothetical protein
MSLIEIILIFYEAVATYLKQSQHHAYLKSGNYYQELSREERKPLLSLTFPSPPLLTQEWIILHYLGSYF